MDSEDLTRWRDKLERYCAYQERCAYDVKQKMNTMKIPLDIQTELLAELKEQKFIDDERYALSYLRSKVNFKKDGIQKIKFALSQKKIDANIIDLALQEIDRTLYQENISKLIEKKWKTLIEKNELKDAKGKLMRYLMSKGYKYDEFKTYLHFLT